jgi:hypothetical protein
MRGYTFQDPDRGILDEAGMRNNTYEAYKDLIKVEIALL